MKKMNQINQKELRQKKLTLFPSQAAISSNSVSSSFYIRTNTYKIQKNNIKPKNNHKKIFCLSYIFTVNLFAYLH